MQREWLLLLSIALGTLRAFQMPAQQALTPSLVPAELLPRALAFSSSGLRATIIAEPALGGALYVAGAEVTYGTCTVLFVLLATLAARPTWSAW